MIDREKARCVCPAGTFLPLQKILPVYRRLRLEPLHCSGSSLSFIFCSVNPAGRNTPVSVPGRQPILMAFMMFPR